MKLLKWLGLLVGLPTVAIALFYIWASSNTQDPQTYASTTTYTPEGGINEGAVLDTSEGFTIVSYNIGYLSGLANNTTERTERAFYDENQQRAIAAIQSIEPDIVALQEIDFAAKRSYKVNQASAIALATTLYNGATVTSWDKNYVPFPYWPPAAHFGKMLSGQAVLTRPYFPIQENRRLVLEEVADRPFFYKAFYLDRLAQITQIELIDQPVIVINVHLEAFVEQTRVNQTKFVRSLAEDYAKTYPVILLGDFNSALNRTEEEDFSINVLMESDVLVSATPPSDWEREPTFPADDPEYKLDYIFYTPETIEVLETQVVKTAGEASDHLPVMMRFKLKE